MIRRSRALCSTAQLLFRRTRRLLEPIMKKRFTIGRVAIALFVGLTVSVLAQSGGGQYRQDDRAGQYGGSLDARQHGYEHGYRDGADRGRQDRDRRLAYSLRPNDYQN